MFTIKINTKIYIYIYIQSQYYNTIPLLIIAIRYELRISPEWNFSMSFLCKKLFKPMQTQS